MVMGLSLLSTVGTTLRESVSRRQQNAMALVVFTPRFPVGPQGSKSDVIFAMRSGCSYQNFALDPPGNLLNKMSATTPSAESYKIRVSVKMAVAAASDTMMAMMNKKWEGYNDMMQKRERERERDKLFL